MNALSTGVRAPSSQRRAGNAHWLVYVVAAGVAIICVGLYHNSRAQNAVTAMARGQFQRAHDFYQVNAAAGDPVAQNALGNLYYLGLGVSKDYNQANRWYVQSARAGNASAQLNLGHMYGQGFGVEVDPVRAFAWYNMANKYGNPAAEYYLTQIKVEWTLSPLMIDSATKRYRKLSDLLRDTPQ